MVARPSALSRRAAVILVITVAACLLGILTVGCTVTLEVVLLHCASSSLEFNRPKSRHHSFWCDFGAMPKNATGGYPMAPTLRSTSDGTAVYPYCDGASEAPRS
jgi:hypothetical protein